MYCVVLVPANRKTSVFNCFAPDLRSRGHRFCSDLTRGRLHAVYQRQLSVPSLRGRLMSTGESWGVNGHITRALAPYPWFAPSASVQWLRKRR